MPVRENGLAIIASPQDYVRLIAEAKPTSSGLFFRPPKEARLLRRSFLATSGAIATAQLTAWPAHAQQAHIKGAGDVLMRRAFE